MSKTEKSLARELRSAISQCVIDVHDIVRKIEKTGADMEPLLYVLDTLDTMNKDLREKY